MADDESAGERSVVHSQSSIFHSPIFFQRILILFCALFISVPVIYKSRSGRDKSTRAAFSVPASSGGYVRISGNVRHAGMYPLAANAMTIAAIKMAEPLSSTLDGLSDIDATAYLVNGMALHVAVRPNGTLLLTKSQMTTSERLVMRVPLEINSMSEADYDKVPGVGPIMAKRIIEYRHNNGGKMMVTDLLSIDGIGEKKYNQLLNYFNYP